MKIGIVDLDTSHPAAWIPLEREMGHEITGLFDGGSIHPEGYAGEFAKEHGIPRVYRSLAEMAAEVDCAIIHGCDWDTHVEKARPFVEAGRAILIDKPFAGNLRDLRQIRDWAGNGAEGENGVRITGGSALRFCTELAEWAAICPGERGVPHTALSGCAVDDFNYGIHAYAFLSEAMGPGIRSVRHLGKGVQRRIQINWADGRMGFLVIGKQDGWLPFYATVATEKSVFQFKPDPMALYRAILEKTLPYLSRQTDVPPVPVAALIEPELAALAARASWLNGDQEVFLEELGEADGYDGAEFAAGYRAAKYGGGSAGR